LRALVVDRAFDGEKLGVAADTAIHVNIGDPYVTGGPSRHAGLTGRKNGIDTYGEYARQSGAALSGKDPSRVDRIGAYAARHAAKNVVAAGLAERCEVHLAYAIGQTEPISLAVDTYDTGRISDDEIAERLARSIDFRPLAVTKRFRLRELPARAGQNGFFRPLAVYGHVGRPDLDLPWEQTDLPLLRDRAGAWRPVSAAQGACGPARWRALAPGSAPDARAPRRPAGRQSAHRLPGGQHGIGDGGNRLVRRRPGIGAIACAASTCLEERTATDLASAPAVTAHPLRACAIGQRPRRHRRRHRPCPDHTLGHGAAGRGRSPLASRAAARASRPARRWHRWPGRRLPGSRRARATEARTDSASASPHR
jgi:hypothetical protein